MAEGSTEDVNVLQDVAAAVVKGDGTVQKQRGCEIARTGTGVYTMTINPVNVDDETVNQPGNLSGDLPADEAIYEANAVGDGSPPAIIAVEETSSTVKTIRTSSGGAAADTDFEIVARRLLG